MTTVAFLVVDSPKVFQFVGHQPLMAWVLEKLCDVRGIDKIICAVTQDLHTQAKKAFDDFAVECVPIPKGLKPQMREYSAWCEAQVSAYDVSMRLKPTTPFLSASKLEKCLRLVTRGTALNAAPARKLGRCESAMACTVRHNRKKGTGEVKTVPVSLIESLDAEDPDEYVLISALVDSGKV